MNTKPTAITTAGNHAAVAAFVALRKAGYDLSANNQVMLAKIFANAIDQLAEKQDPNIIPLPMNREINRRKSDRL